VGLLSAVAASVVLVAVSAQVFIGLNKVQSGAEVDSAYNQMLQLVGLNPSSPGACSLFLTDRFLLTRLCRAAGAGRADLI